VGYLKAADVQGSCKCIELTVATADKKWSSSIGVGRGAINSQAYESNMLQKEMDSLEPEKVLPKSEIKKNDHTYKTSVGLGTGII